MDETYLLTVEYVAQAVDGRIEFAEIITTEKWICEMSETYLMTIETVVQVGDDLLIFPTLSSDKYYLADIMRVKIVKPDNQVVETDAEFSIPFTTPERRNIYLGLIPYTQKDAVPVGSQIWVYKTLEEITRQSE